MNLKSFWPIVPILLLVYLWWSQRPSSSDPSRPLVADKPTRPSELTKTPSPRPSAQAVSTRAVALEPPPTTKPVAHERAALPPHFPQSVSFRVREGYAVTQGDVILGKPSPPMDDGATGHALMEEPQLWNSSKIRYFITPQFPQPERIQKAVEHLEQNTPLRFAVLESDQEDAIVFQRSQELCGSYMGRLGGPQPILIADHCDWNDVSHEILHALGFPHEHARPDRDQFVQINYANIVDGLDVQFDKLPLLPIADVLEATGFDPTSVMMYPRNAFAKQPQLETIRMRDGTQVISPSRQGLSRVDKERVTRLFQNR